MFWGKQFVRDNLDNWMAATASLPWHLVCLDGNCYLICEHFSFCFSHSQVNIKIEVNKKYLNQQPGILSSLWLKTAVS
jgi:hypothetical protein